MWYFVNCFSPSHLVRSAWQSSMRARPNSARSPVATSPASPANGHRRSGSDARPAASSGGTLDVSSWRMVQLFKRALRTVGRSGGYGQHWEKVGPRCRCTARVLTAAPSCQFHHNLPRSLPYFSERSCFEFNIQHTDEFLNESATCSKFLTQDSTLSGDRMTS